MKKKVLACARSFSTGFYSLLVTPTTPTSAWKSSQRSASTRLCTSCLRLLPFHLAGLSLVTAPAKHVNASRWPSPRPLSVAECSWRSLDRHYIRRGSSNVSGRCVGLRCNQMEGFFQLAKQENERSAGTANVDDILISIMLLEAWTDLQSIDGPGS